MISEKNYKQQILRPILKNRPQFESKVEKRYSDINKKIREIIGKCGQEPRNPPLNPAHYSWYIQNNEPPRGAISIDFSASLEMTNRVLLELYRLTKVFSAVGGPSTMPAFETGVCD